MNARERTSAGSAVGVAARTGGLLAASGLLFVALFAAGLLAGNLLSDGAYVTPFGSDKEIERYFASNRDSVRVSGLLQVLSAVSLLPFAACVSALARRASREESPLPSLSLVGGALAAAFLLLSGLLSWVLSRPATSEVVSLLRTVQDLAFLVGGPAHVVSLAALTGAGSLAALGTGSLPRWVAWMGIAAAVVSLLCVVSLLWTPASVLIPLGRLLSFVWIVNVSLVLVRTSGKPG